MMEQVRVIVMAHPMFFVSLGLFAFLIGWRWSDHVRRVRECRDTQHQWSETVTGLECRRCGKTP